jgi:hypothetical protein
MKQDKNVKKSMIFDPVNPMNPVKKLIPIKSLYNQLFQF